MCPDEMLSIQYVTKANFLKYGQRLLEITSNYSTIKCCKIILKIFLLLFFKIHPLPIKGILSERQDAKEPDIFTDLTQVQATDYESDPNAAESPYFSGGGSNRRASGGYKRKRATKGAGGDKKLVKKGKWYSKSKASKEKRSSSSTKSTTASSFQRSSTGSSFHKSASTPYKSAASTSKGSGGLLAPPRSRTVKKD
jgi:hypothetical protein